MLETEYYADFIFETDLQCRCIIYIVNLKKVNVIKLECVEYDTVNPVILGRSSFRDLF